MTDTSKYANVSLKRETYNKLKDLSAINETPISKSAMITYIVDKEWKRKINSYVYVTPAQRKHGRFTRWWVTTKAILSRSSSEGKSNDN